QGYVLIDMGCHCAEICRSFIGKDVRPMQAFAHHDTMVHPIAAEDFSIGLVRFENGAVGQIESSWTFRGGMDLRDEVSGTEGTIWLNHWLRTGFEMFSSGGGQGYVLIDMGCHCAEICRSFIGKDVRPMQAFAHHDTMVHPIAAEDFSIGLVRFENGAVGQIESSWTFRGGMDLRDEVSGTEGTIWLNHWLRTGFEMFSSGGGQGYVLIDMGCHCAEICRSFIGKDVRPMQAFAHHDTMVHPIAAEDFSIGLVRFENGAVGQIESSWTFRGGMDLRDEVSGTE
ncbi:unnamed protein product, partial [marine sediment metagenome]